MAASQPAYFNPQEFSDAGVLLVGGRLYTYAYGTTNQKTAYTDPDGVIPHTYTPDGLGGQYIALNARGELPASLFLGAGSYDLSLKRADGSTVWTRKADGVDNTTNSLASQLASAIGATLIGFLQTGVGGILRALLDKLRERVSVDDFGTDSAAIQKAVDSLTRGVVEFTRGGTYTLNATVTPKPGIDFHFNGATLNVASGVEAFKRTTDGFPGNINFRKGRFIGTGKTGRAIAFTNNTPLVGIEDCYAEGFNEAFLLDGSYNSMLKKNHIVGNNFGIVLLNESHATTLIDNFVDANTYANLCINGDPVNGSRGATPIHNITVLGGALQGAEFGLWAEKCYELHVTNIYHEGNTKADMRLGVADSGVYARACYNFTINGWQSSSACALGRNIIMEHAVNGNLRGLAFNSGTSNAVAVLSADGFSDLIDIDYHRVQHASISTAFSLPAAKVIVSQNGRKSIPWNVHGLKFGTLGAEEGELYGGLTSGSRPTLIRSSLGTNQDITDKCTGIERHEDSAGNLRWSIDHVNTRVEFGYILRPMTDNTLQFGEASRRAKEIFAGTGTINTSDADAKQDDGPIPHEWLDAWANVQWCRFKFKDAAEIKGRDGARWHVGLIAQRVRDAFQAQGIDPFEIGLLCYDEWDEERAAPGVDADGNEIPGEIVISAGQRFGIRYEEALAMECAYLRSKCLTAP